MVNNIPLTKTISVEHYGIKNATVQYQFPSDELQRITIAKGQGIETASRALVIKTGAFTGRAPKDRFIVKDAMTKADVWWADINIPFDPDAFDRLYDKVVDYLSGKPLFVRDCYACADKNYRLNIRAVNEFAWSNMFIYNMFLSPDEKELEHFIPEWTIISAPGFMANPKEDGTRQGNFTILNFTRNIVLIGGTGYTGEMKKGIFSVLNYKLPMYKKVLPMHCSANVGEDGKTAIFFGLSGTGKTTLSTVPERKLIGDDEHGWTSENTVFNFEGGCYAKVLNLTEASEPDIYNAIRHGAILENVILDANGVVDFTDDSITQNTRVSYPIHHIENIQPSLVGQHPKNIFFLTADAFGVLPPVARLTPGQAAYHFISGYTAKVAGTEEGINEPVPHFSACFGAPFMPLHPVRYAEMLSEKIQRSGVNVWLINTGWTGGPYGLGSRVKLKYTRAMISAALEDKLNAVPYETHPVFNLAMPTYCPNVPTGLLNPRATWKDKAAYDVKAAQLARSFKENFKKFEAYANSEILAGAPG